jgi:hypothetical protein
MVDAIECERYFEGYGLLDLLRVFNPSAVYQMNQRNFQRL